MTQWPLGEPGIFPMDQYTNCAGGSTWRKKKQKKTSERWREWERRSEIDVAVISLTFVFRKLRPPGSCSSTHGLRVGIFIMVEKKKDSQGWTVVVVLNYS